MRHLPLAVIAVLSAALPGPASAGTWEEGPMFTDDRLQPILLFRTLFVYTQEDTRTVAGPGGQPLVLDTTKMDASQFGHRDGFVLDSVEVGLKGRFEETGIYYQGKFELVPREADGNRSSDYLKDAYAGWNKFKWLDVAAGRMKIPFSQATLKSTADQELVYAPTLTTLTPKRQLGVRVSGGDPGRIVRLSGGVFDSVALATEQLNSTDQLLYVARLDLRVDNALRALNLHFLDFEWNLAADVAWVKQNYDPPTEHRWVGFDSRLHLWRFTLEGELVLKDFYAGDLLPDGTMKADRGWGWHVDLTGHAWPKVLDVTARLEEMDGDTVVRGAGATLSIDELAKQKKHWFTVGVIWYVTERARLDFNYVQRRELEGYSFDNDVFLGMFQYSM